MMPLYLVVYSIAPSAGTRKPPLCHDRLRLAPEGPAARARLTRALSALRLMASIRRARFTPVPLRALQPATSAQFDGRLARRYFIGASTFAFRH